MISSKCVPLIVLLAGVNLVLCCQKQEPMQISAPERPVSINVINYRSSPMEEKMPQIDTEAMQKLNDVLNNVKATNEELKKEHAKLATTKAKPAATKKPDPEKKPDCTQLKEQTWSKCCQRYSPGADQFMAQRRKINDQINAICLPVPKKDNLKCDLDICVAEKTIYGSKGGHFNKGAIVEALDQYIMNEPLLVEKIKKNCLGPDLSKYSEHINCDYLRFNHCLDAHQYNSCQAWNDGAECQEFRNLLGKCT